MFGYNERSEWTLRMGVHLILSINSEQADFDLIKFVIDVFLNYWQLKIIGKSVGATFSLSR